MSPKNGLKGQIAYSPGHRPGLFCDKVEVALSGQKTLAVNAFVLTGRSVLDCFPQGDALGFEMAGLSGRPYARLRMTGLCNSVILQH